MIRVLFVCMGNICRSPTAEGVFRALLRERRLEHAIAADSAGTHGYHVGQPPDRRAQAAARRRGIDLGTLRARQVMPEDFATFDHVLAMDLDNLGCLELACPAEHRHKLGLFLDYAPQAGAREVPDPYYGGEHGFEHVLDLVSQASSGLLEQLRGAAPRRPA